VCERSRFIRHRVSRTKEARHTYKWVGRVADGMRHEYERVEPNIFIPSTHTNMLTSPTPTQICSIPQHLHKRAHFSNANTNTSNTHQVGWNGSVCCYSLSLSSSPSLSHSLSLAPPRARTSILTSHTPTQTHVTNTHKVGGVAACAAARVTHAAIVTTPAHGGLQCVL